MSIIRNPREELEHKEWLQSRKFTKPAPKQTEQDNKALEWLRK